MRGDVLAVIGAQYGSEGKGNIVHHLADRYDMHVRVGGPNAGHSIFCVDRVWKMQMLPCGWTNRHAKLIIGRGAVVDLDILAREVREVSFVSPGIRERLYIDAGAFVLDEQHHATEGGTKGELHHRIGSTGEGVGAARHARMSRDTSRIERVGDSLKLGELGLESCVTESTATLLNNWHAMGYSILLEGTQGSGLSLWHGEWPYVTSHDTNAAQFAADVGLPPRFVNRCLLVARTFPIRVAGNSGPLRYEIDEDSERAWAKLSEHIGRPTMERTTVTQKVRRVGEWDADKVAQAIMLNAPTSLALNFMDYMFPSCEGCSSYADLPQGAIRWIAEIEHRWGIPVAFIGTGGTPWTVIDRGLRP